VSNHSISHLVSGLKILMPEKCFSLLVTTTQSLASAMAAIIMSSALRGRPDAVPWAINLPQIKAADSSNASTRPDLSNRQSCEKQVLVSLSRHPAQQRLRGGSEFACER
jgi:hypothetical protein